MAFHTRHEVVLGRLPRLVIGPHYVAAIAEPRAGAVFKKTYKQGQNTQQAHPEQTEEPGSYVNPVFLICRYVNPEPMKEALPSSRRLDISVFLRKKHSTEERGRAPKGMSYSLDSVHVVELKSLRSGGETQLIYPKPAVSPAWVGKRKCSHLRQASVPGLVRRCVVSSGEAGPY